MAVSSTGLRVFLGLARERQWKGKEEWEGLRVSHVKSVGGLVAGQQVSLSFLKQGNRSVVVSTSSDNS